MTLFPDALFALLLLLLGIGLALLWRSTRQRKELRLPEGKTIYADTPETPGTLLYSEKYRLKGKPDFLIKHEQTIIPVEAKTGRTPRQPYKGQIMQLMAYCILVEENYGLRPTHGVIRYPDSEFEIEFTSTREKQLAEILEDMHQKREQDDVHRSHSNPRVCTKCGYRDVCSEKLDYKVV